MVILQIHIDYIATIKRECDPPISGYPHRVGAFPITREPMKFQPRQVHILRLHRGVQSVQNSMYAVGLLGIYSRRSLLVKNRSSPLWRKVRITMRM